MRVRSRRAERGASAVEFALVVMPFTVLVFGIISFGIVFAQQLALGNAARDAARAAVVETQTCGQVKAIASNAARTISMNGADVVVSVQRVPASGVAVSRCQNAAADASKPCAGSAANDSIQVTTRFTSKLVIPLLFTRDIELASRGTFRCEFS